MPEVPRYMDINLVFTWLWGQFEQVILWEQLHGITVWGKTFSFFDISVGLFASWLITRLIPIFGDPEDEDTEYDYFGGYEEV